MIAVNVAQSCLNQEQTSLLRREYRSFAALALILWLGDLQHKNLNSFMQYACISKLVHEHWARAVNLEIV